MGKVSNEYKCLTAKVVSNERYVRSKATWGPNHKLTFLTVWTW